MVEPSRPRATAVDVRIVRTTREREDAYSLRIAVFVDEQGIPRDEELDELDEPARALAAQRRALPRGRRIGVGRRGTDADQLQRMAAAAQANRSAVARDDR